METGNARALDEEAWLFYILLRRVALFLFLAAKAEKTQKHLFGRNGRRVVCLHSRNVISLWLRHVEFTICCPAPTYLRAAPLPTGCFRFSSQHTHGYDTIHLSTKHVKNLLLTLITFRQPYCLLFFPLSLVPGLTI